MLPTQFKQEQEIQLQSLKGEIPKFTNCYANCSHRLCLDFSIHTLVVQVAVFQVLA